MNYIIMDLEWNQALSKSQIIKAPVCLTGEIIQIGAVKLDENFNFSDTFKIMVKPKHYTVMHKVVETLTHINNDDLESGVTFPEAFEKFKEWCGNDFVFLTWGPDDVPMLRNNMILHGISKKLIPQYYNLQIIFNEQISKENCQFSLSDAVSIVNEEEYSVHDALNDALNTYNICKHLNLTEGIENYSARSKKKKGDQPQNVLNMYDVKNPPNFYRSKRRAMRSSDVLFFKCPKCGETAQCSEIVNQRCGRGDRKITVAECTNGDCFFVRFKFQREEEHGCLFVKRLVYDLDDASKKMYSDRITAEL